MRKAGLALNESQALKALRAIVKRYGPNCARHFNELLKENGTGDDPRIVAAGIVAYHIELGGDGHETKASRFHVSQSCLF